MIATNLIKRKHHGIHPGRQRQHHLPDRPLGHKSYYEYDSMNRLVKITLYAGEETGEDGGTIQTGAQTTLYTYDHRGLVTTEINALGDGKYYVYDEAGNLISVTDEDGYVTEHTYDALNRLGGTGYNGTK